ADLNATDTTTVIDTEPVDGGTAEANFFSAGMKILIGTELMKITDVDLGTDDITVTRGVNSSTKTTHTDGDDILIVISILALDDGDEIDVAYGVRAAVTTVDAEAPSIDDEFPADGSFLSANTILLGAEVTDSGVGLGDDLNVKANTELRFIDGTPVGIIGQPDSVNDDDDPVFKVIYSLGLVEDVYDWELTIFDLVGNSTVDNFDLTVDRDDPRMLQATTGIAYDSDDKSTEADRNSIVIVFENTDGSDEFLDKASLDASDFVVENNEVIGVVFPNLEPGDEDDNGVDFTGVPGAGGDSPNDESRHVVFLTLRDELEADEEPLVQILAAAVEDLAGNGNSAQSLDADDGIAPEFTITIDGEASSRPVVIGKADHVFTVTVTSDEPLDGNDPPAIYFLSLDTESDQGTFFSDVEVQTVVAELNADPAGTNTWETEQDGDIFTSSFSGLVVVFVVGTDENGNENTSKGVDPSGVSPTRPLPNDLVDLSDADGDNALIEFDSLFADPDFEVRPETDADTTESSSPFIVLDFDEGKEYSIDIDADSSDAGVTGLDGPADKIDDIEIDTHDTVTLTSVELDGVDVSGQVGRRDDDSFVIALRDLAVGEYTLTCTAVDEVGNDIDADDCKFDFEVVERGDYEVPLDPGWNLVSLPGTPADPAIDSVLPSSMSASRVLQWVGGAFEVAERGDDGMWDPSGQITEITAGPGYWVFTTAFEDIETLIPERYPATVLPTVDIVGGWNLVGIVDLAQADAGDAPGDTEGRGMCCPVRTSPASRGPWRTATTRPRAYGPSTQVTTQTTAS
ncbi:MAG: hypothetical protein IIC94_08135, partial [Chloroflexi bacterium]|nr:hypothetical protein [Chloroflexota bacterium]